jgi:hypothetical protein
MDELRRFAVALALIVLAGIALDRIFGEAAMPFVFLAVFQLVRVTWDFRRQRQLEMWRTLAEIRAYDASERAQIVARVESADLRHTLRGELARDGTETIDGATETFPFPARFRRDATVRYWRDWFISAGALSIAALSPGLGSIWRFLWLVGGIAVLWRVRRHTLLYRAVSSVIEINPFMIALVGHDGTRVTIPFASKPTCEDVPEDGLLFVRSSPVAIPVSYRLIGFNRIAKLVEAYGASIPSIDASPS